MGRVIIDGSNTVCTPNISLTTFLRKTQLFPPHPILLQSHHSYSSQHDSAMTWKFGPIRRLLVLFWMMILGRKKEVRKVGMWMGCG